MSGSNTETCASKSMRIIRTAVEMRDAVEPARNDGAVVGLVPTMGALHAGHLALVRRARRDCGLVVVSLFVNPTQFSANEDFDSYPRDEAHDLELLERNGVDIVYAPTAAEMYPDGFGVTVTVTGLTEGLVRRETARSFRRGHDSGLETVRSLPARRCIFRRKGLSAA